MTRSWSAGNEFGHAPLASAWRADLAQPPRSGRGGAKSSLGDEGVSSTSYRLYLRSANRIVCRHEFAAPNDAEAHQVAELLAEAASDLCNSFEVWQGARVVAWGRGPVSAGGGERSARVEAALVQAAATILHGEWDVARSNLLAVWLAERNRQPDTNLLERLVRAAVSASGAHTGNIQLLDRGGNLRIVAQHGLEREFLDFFAVITEQDTSCGRAAKEARRIMVEDVATSPIFAGTRSGGVMLRAGLRSTYSTPLLVRGRLRGMLSTHRKINWRPDADELRTIDRIASEAASVIGQ